MPDALRELWLINNKGLFGAYRTDDKDVSILSRIVRWHNDEMFYEVDPRHVGKLLKDFGDYSGSQA